VALLFFCIVPNISHICKSTGQKLPEDGQIFYMRRRDGKDPPRDEWFYEDPPEPNSCGGGYAFLKEEQLVESGKYKWKWHDCEDGTARFEWKGDGSSGWFKGIGLEKIKNSDPCSARKTRKYVMSDILSDNGLWNYYDIYIPPVCSTMRPMETHCNCGGASAGFEYSKTIGISKTKGSTQRTTNTLRSEIQVGIKATASVGIPFIGETEFEASASTSIAGEISSSFLTSSSTTWREETTTKIKLDVPAGKCTTLYQAVAYYGEFEVGGPRTVNKERDAVCRRK